MENVQILGVVSGLATQKAQVRSRFSHTLIYKESGESIYYLRGKSVHLRAGTLLYIPQGENYDFEKISEGESRYTLVNFYMSDTTTGAPQLFCLPAGEKVVGLFRQMERAARLNQREGRYECLSVFYHLLAILARHNEARYATAEQKHRIEPGVEYLVEHLFDPALKIGILPQMCSLSAPSFRQAFVARFGISPKRYVIYQRLSMAKNILDSGEYASVSEVAHSVGFEDALYFSKLFSKHFGIPPSAAKNVVEIINE